MNYFGALVDFKNKGVVYLVLPEDLDVHASGYDDKHDNES